MDITNEEGMKQKNELFIKYLEGLQWVLYYYYRGIKNWRWFYPSHYAPMVSDFRQFDYSKINFDDLLLKEDSSPYLPYQSLIFILPESSFDLLPKCYESIPKELKHLYPEHFDIDFNGKKAPWEALVLLPFLDEKLILEKEQQLRNLTPEEEKYNQWGETYLYSENKKEEPSKKEVYKIYQENNETKLERNYKEKKVKFNFPSLWYLDFVPAPVEVKLYFGRNFRKVREISLTLQPKKLNTEIINGFLLSKNIFYDYPSKLYGNLKGFVFKYKFYYIFKDQMWIDSNFQLYFGLVEKIRQEWEKKGVFLSCPDILCCIAPFEKIVIGNDGKKKLIFSKKEIYVPFETTSLNNNNRSRKDFAKCVKSIKDQLKE